MLAFIRDITERKAPSEALRASEEQYRAIFDASADALVLRDADFRIVDVNPAYERCTASRARRWSATSAGALIPPRAAAASGGADPTRALAGGSRSSCETVGVRKDGTRFDVELRCVPIQHRGQPHVLTMARDITERRRARAALRASEEQYRAIFNASADALVLRDRRVRASSTSIRPIER